jgi:hypothetical protein
MLTAGRQAERFFREMADVPKMGARIASLLYQQQFLGRVRDLAVDAATLAAASREVKESDRLRIVLEHILQVGNRLNDGSGPIRAFTLSSLLKLAHVCTGAGALSACGLRSRAAVFF